MFPLKDDIPLRGVPWLILAIIATNVLVFLWQLGEGPRNEYGILAYGMVPRALAASLGLDPPPILSPQWRLLDAAYDPAVPVPFTVLTSMFMHGGWAHLLGNMWSLWIFGNNVEDEIGPDGFAAFYLLCGAGAALTQTFVDLASPIPMVGASGAIAGVLGAYLVRFPHARILTLVPFVLAWLIRVPAGVWLVIWFLGQVLSSLAAPAAGVAWYAHIGGFVTGMVVGPVLMGARGRRRRRRA